MADPVDRRAFLKGLGVAGAAAAAPGVANADPTAPAEQPAQAPATPSGEPPVNTYVFLSPPEAAFIEAAVDTLIPADELTPSGTDCGVSVFIDRQLAGAWGQGDRLYMQGPWATGTPQQGYQLPMTPAELFRAGIAATNAHCREVLDKEFDRLSAGERAEVLTGLERDTIDLGRVPARSFFDALLSATMEGFFADPIYGGNRDKVAWKMVGFPGVIAIYADAIRTYRNKPYDREPVSIVDMA